MQYNLILRMVALLAAIPGVLSTPIAPYSTPTPTPYSTPYGTPYSASYGTSYGTPYGTPYGSAAKDDHDKISCLKNSENGYLAVSDKATIRACMDFRNRANGYSDSKPTAVCDDCTPAAMIKDENAVATCQSVGKHLDVKQFQSYCMKYDASEIREW